MEREESLERVCGQLLRDALQQVGPWNGNRAKRQAFARVAYFLTRSVRPDERLVADLLAAAIGSTDHPVVLRCVACSVWAAVDEDPRLLRWFGKIADRALELRHLPGFCVALELLVHLPTFQPQLPDAWLAGIRDAREDERARAYAFWVGWYWEDRFHPDGAPPPPPWLFDLRQDERVLAAAAVVEGERGLVSCPACGRAFSP